jgi:hypothetical protein
LQNSGPASLGAAGGLGSHAYMAYAGVGGPQLGGEAAGGLSRGLYGQRL